MPRSVAQPTLDTTTPGQQTGAMHTKETLRNQLAKALRESGRSFGDIEKLTAGAVNRAHLSRYLHGTSEMDLDKIEAVAKAIQTDVPSLLRQGSDVPAARRIPIIPFRRLPLGITGAALVTEARKISHDELVALVEHPDALGLRLEDPIGDYHRGDIVIIVPTAPVKGDDVVCTLDGERYLVPFQEYKGRFLATIHGETRDDALLVGMVAASVRYRI